MKKSLTLLAAGAFALTGCDFAGGTEASIVPVASIEVSNLPAANGQQAWDADGTAPDVYVEIRNAAGRAIYRSEAQQDVTAETVSFPVSAAIEVPFAAMAMYINVYETDGDPIFAQEMAASDAFTIDQLATGDVSLSDIKDRGAQITIVSKAQVSAAE